MNVKRITAVLFVKEIEPVLPFWVDKLGFAKTIEVPHGGKLGFVAVRGSSSRGPSSGSRCHSSIESG